MTTTNPLDRIEVGKRYRLVHRLAEVPPCSGCGHSHGETESARAYNHVVVTVVRSCTNICCPKCGHRQNGVGGWYHVRATDGKCAAVPYTFLQPLEPSGPEPRGG